MTEKTDMSLVSSLPGTKMASFSCRATTLVLVCSCLLLLLQEASGAPRCEKHDQEAPKNCRYGTTLDWCKNGVCAKGPGETCGGYRWSEGKCGEGTFCSCGICGGCSPFDGKCGPTSIC
uniref:Neuroparsin n=2 Tax=Scylla olivacea TaxID=85551 RepID=A0A0P4WCD5_SCYOL